MNPVPRDHWNTGQLNLRLLKQDHTQEHDLDLAKLIFLLLKKLILNSTPPLKVINVKPSVFPFKAMVVIPPLFLYTVYSTRKAYFFSSLDSTAAFFSTTVHM